MSAKITHPMGNYLAVASLDGAAVPSDRDVDVPVFDHGEVQSQVIPVMDELGIARADMAWVPDGARLRFASRNEAVKFRLRFTGQSAS